MAAERKTIAKAISVHFATKFDKEWVKWKLTTDPLFSSLIPWLGTANNLPVLDVGCGRGLLGFFLRESGISAAYTGIDFDEAKIKAAQAVASQYTPPPQYHALDARQSWPVVSGHVCLLDVLHYLPAKEQASLLQQCASRVSPEGSFIIRSGIRDTSGRYRFTASTDKVMATFGLMKSPPVSYPTLEELGAIFEKAGLEMTEMQVPTKGSWFNNHLMVCRKKRS